MTIKVELGWMTADRNFAPESVHCLGAFALEPITVVDGKYRRHTALQRGDKITRQYAQESPTRTTTRKRKK